VESSLIIYALIGFVAQLVDSSIGMAFGSLSSSLLLAIGFPAQSLSMTVHMTEIFGGSASAISHWRMNNLDYTTLKKLALPAIIGTVIGALLVTQFNNGALVPWLGCYFILIGTTIIIKTLYPSLIRVIKTHRRVLGFIGGFLDAFGGAGWGEFVSSGLLLRGHEVRKVVGSLVTVEFMVAVTVSVIFYSTIGITHWPEIIALSLGAIAAAPLGAWICKKAPSIPLTLVVGLVIVIIGLKTLVFYIW
jgi:uncharacterized membrane protein YfcA